MHYSPTSRGSVVQSSDRPGRTIEPSRQDPFGGIVPYSAIIDLGPMPRRLAVASIHLPGIAISCGEVHGIAVRALSTSPDTGNASVLIMAHSAGLLCHAPGAEPERIAADHALITTADRRPLMTFDRPGRLTLIRVEMRRLRPFLGSLTLTTPLRFPPDTPGMGLLLGQAQSIVAQRTLGPELVVLAASQLIDMAVLVLGGGAGVQPAAPTAGDTHDPRKAHGTLKAHKTLKASRLAAIKAEMAASFGNATLSVTTIARKHKISTRYVHIVFREAGTTFSTYLLGLRLDFVVERLRNPESRDVRIAEIAFDAGFAELSAFNRAFRRRFGLSPSEMRAHCAASP